MNARKHSTELHNARRTRGAHARAGERLAARDADGHRDLDEIFPRDEGLTRALVAYLH